MDKGIKSYSDLLRNILKLKTYPVGLKICEWFISRYGVVFCISCPRYEFYNYCPGRISKPGQASPSNISGVSLNQQVKD